MDWPLVKSRSWPKSYHKTLAQSKISLLTGTQFMRIRWKQVQLPKELTNYGSQQTRLLFHHLLKSWEMLKSYRCCSSVTPVLMILTCLKSQKCFQLSLDLSKTKRSKLSTFLITNFLVKWLLNVSNLFLKQIVQLSTSVLQKITYQHKMYNLY